MARGSVDVLYQPTDPVLYLPKTGSIYRGSGLAIPLSPWQGVFEVLANRPGHRQPEIDGEPRVVGSRLTYWPVPIPLDLLTDSMRQAGFSSFVVGQLNVSGLTTKIDRSPEARVVVIDRPGGIARLNRLVTVLDQPPKLNRALLPPANGQADASRKVKTAAFDWNDFLSKHPINPENPPFSPPTRQVNILASRIMEIVAPFTEERVFISRATAAALLMSSPDSSRARSYFDQLFPGWVRQLRSGGVGLHSFGQSPNEVLAVTGYVHSLRDYLEGAYAL